jgi:hypothetical protein
MFTFRCRHMVLAVKAADYAPKTEVSLQDLEGLTDEQTSCLKKHSKDGKLELHSLPGGNICVPLLDVENEDCTGHFTHVMNGKVNICTKSWC